VRVHIHKLVVLLVFSLPAAHRSGTGSSSETPLALCLLFSSINVSPADRCPGPSSSLKVLPAAQTAQVRPFPGRLQTRQGERSRSV
jgi:hypothetical protein